MILEPLESVNSQLVFFMIDRYLHDSDRYNRICGMYLNACMTHLIFTVGGGGGRGWWVGGGGAWW